VVLGEREPRNGIVMLAVPGPPRVMTKMKSKALKAPTTLRMPTISRVGRIIGSMMRVTT
jgi:molybdopterin-biosynthesis enzyme MoeA-like protein